MATKNRMQEWQEEQDFRDWKRCLEKAIARSDYVRVHELVNEGISEGYSFSFVSDEETWKIFQDALSSTN